MKKRIGETIFLIIILFWSAFWPAAYFTLSHLNDKLREEVKQSEYLPSKEKIKMIGEH